MFTIAGLVAFTLLFLITLIYITTDRMKFALTIRFILATFYILVTILIAGGEV